MPNGTYGGVRGRKTKVGRKLLRFPPTRFFEFLKKELFFLYKYLLGLKEVWQSHRKCFLLVGCFWQLKCKN